MAIDAKVKPIGYCINLKLYTACVLSRILKKWKNLLTNGNLPFLGNKQWNSPPFFKKARIKSAKADLLYAGMVLVRSLLK